MPPFYLVKEAYLRIFLKHSFLVERIKQKSHDPTAGQWSLTRHGAGAYSARLTCVRRACARIDQCPHSTPSACGQSSRWWWGFPPSEMTIRPPCDRPESADTVMSSKTHWK